MKHFLLVLVLAAAILAIAFVLGFLQATQAADYWIKLLLIIVIVVITGAILKFFWK